MLRTSNLAKQNQIKTDTNCSDAIDEISEMMKNVNTHNEINNGNINTNTNTNTSTNTNTNIDTDINQNLKNIKQETIINNIINKTDENETKVGDNENTIDDLANYLN